MIKLTASQFQWSETEQVYPNEIALDGSILYCAMVDFGLLPNNGTKNVAHNLVGVLGENIVKFFGNTYHTSNTFQTLPFAHTAGSTYNIILSASSENITISTKVNYTAHYAKVFLVYKK